MGSDNQNKYKSDIEGIGFGSSHLWKKLYTHDFKITNGKAKVDQFKCRKCGATFIHRYDTNIEIWQEIKNSKIADTC